MNNTDSEDFYSLHASQFIAKADQVDPARFLEPFTRYLIPRALVFDVGCGTGRDLAWLQNKGFNTLGLERSPELAACAEKKLRHPIIKADFEDYDFTQHAADGLLLVSALVHLPHFKFDTVLGRIIQAARHSAPVYLSLKEGCDSRQDRNGRTFYLWQPDQLITRFNSLGLSILYFDRTESGLGTAEPFLSYVLQKIASPRIEHP